MDLVEVKRSAGGEKAVPASSPDTPERGEERHIARSPAGLPPLSGQTRLLPANRGPAVTNRGGTTSAPLVRTMRGAGIFPGHAGDSEVSS